MLSGTVAIEPTCPVTGTFQGYYLANAYFSGGSSSLTALMAVAKISGKYYSKDCVGGSITIPDAYVDKTDIELKEGCFYYDTNNKIVYLYQNGNIIRLNTKEFNYSIVESLPDTGSETTLYLVKQDDGTYESYVYGSSEGFMKVGGGSTYTLEQATSTTLGGIKIGYTLGDWEAPVELDSNGKAYTDLYEVIPNVSSSEKGLMTATMYSGTFFNATNAVSVSETEVTLPFSKAKVGVPSVGTSSSDSTSRFVIPAATTTTAGVMTAADKEKLDNFPSVEVLTQEEYDALETKEEGKVYFISGS